LRFRRLNLSKGLYAFFAGYLTTSLTTGLALGDFGGSFLGSTGLMGAGFGLGFFVSG